MRNPFWIHLFARVFGTNASSLNASRGTSVWPLLQRRSDHTAGLGEPSLNEKGARQEKQAPPYTNPSPTPKRREAIKEQHTIMDYSYPPINLSGLYMGGGWKVERLLGGVSRNSGR